MKRVILIVAILCLSATSCLAAPQPKKEVKQGNLLYNKGEFPGALKQYEEALSRAPDSDVVNFDLGNALYKTEDYKQAIGHFEKSLVSDNQSLEKDASYNLGNAKYKFGIAQEDADINIAVDSLRQSLRHYERAMELDPKDEDAKYNYDFVKKELARLEEKQQKQESQQQGESESEKKESQQQQAQQQQQESEQKKSEQGQAEAEQKEGQSQQQQEQQQEEQQQGQQAEAKSSEDKNEEAERQAGESAEPVGQMSEKEAQMLLESYRHEEEPKGLLKFNVPTHNLPEVTQDW